MIIRKITYQSNLSGSDAVILLKRNSDSTVSINLFFKNKEVSPVDFAWAHRTAMIEIVTTGLCYSASQDLYAFGDDKLIAVNDLPLINGVSNEGA